MSAVEFRTKLEELVLQKIRSKEFIQSLLVIDGGLGFVVELTHDGALKLLSAVQDAVYEVNGSLSAAPGEIIVAQDRVIVTYVIEIFTSEGVPVFKVARVGECLLNKTTKTAQFPDDNATRTAETRALKRAISSVLPVIHERFKYWSEWVANRAQKYPPMPKHELMQRLQKDLVTVLEKKLEQEQ